MTDPWAEMREFTFYFDDGDKARSLLRDADALLAVVQLAQEAFGKDGQYGPGALGDALAALPEHLK
ncbi:hypothetical protein LCGC14_2325200 [marine sediment metagenome]|uniref:Uncharacterized protein n=1 Tax=marine sediment metagenome TaxID=412755 RepID=A0A0F9CGM4_9ZZZZ